MRHLTLITLTLLLIASCKKEINNNKPDLSGYVQNVKAALKDSLTSNDYAALDFNRAVLSKVDRVQLYLLRIPLKGKEVKNDFVIVKTNVDGKIERGKIVHIEGADTAFGNIRIKSFYGSIIISSLSGTIRMQSVINNGYILAFHPQTNLRTTTVSPVYPSIPVLPEVIVYSYIHTSSGISFSDWYLLQSLFYDSDFGGGGMGGYYSSLDGTSGGGGGGGGYTGGYDGSGDGSLDYGLTVTVDDMVEIEAEYIYNLTGVDLSKMFKCFDNVPSIGATYSIRLCSDIPSNSNPNASANFSAASGGHTFLTISKTNGSTSVTQSFGFYPSSQPSWIDPFSPVTSTLKDNGAQEINASLEMNLTETQFNTVKQNAISWSTRNYELTDYNCSNYAVDIFNSVRTTPIIIPGYQIVLPGNTNPWAPNNPVTVTINKSPQMLFSKLQEMKNNNDPESSKIVIDQSHNYMAPISKGECN
jgi:hypothetical protein